MTFTDAPHDPKAFLRFARAGAGPEALALAQKKHFPDSHAFMTLLSVKCLERILCGGPPSPAIGTPHQTHYDLEKKELFLALSTALIAAPPILKNDPNFLGLTRAHGGCSDWFAAVCYGLGGFSMLDNALRHQVALALAEIDPDLFIKKAIVYYSGKVSAHTKESARPAWIYCSHLWQAPPQFWRPFWQTSSPEDFQAFIEVCLRPNALQNWTCATEIFSQCQQPQLDERLTGLKSLHYLDALVGHTYSFLANDADCASWLSALAPLIRWAQSHDGGRTQSTVSLLLSRLIQIIWHQSPDYQGGFRRLASKDFKGVQALAPLDMIARHWHRLNIQPPSYLELSALAQRACLEMKGGNVVRQSTPPPIYERFTAQCAAGLLENYLSERPSVPQSNRAL